MYPTYACPAGGGGWPAGPLACAFKILCPFPAAFLNEGGGGGGGFGVGGDQITSCLFALFLNEDSGGGGVFGAGGEWITLGLPALFLNEDGCGGGPFGVDDDQTALFLLALFLNENGGGGFAFVVPDSPPPGGSDACLWCQGKKGSMISGPDNGADFVLDGVVGLVLNVYSHSCGD